MKPINYKNGHKIPFIGLLGMKPDQFKQFNRLTTDTRVFVSKSCEELNMKRLIL